jgi:hypothetical protein
VGRPLGGSEWRNDISAFDGENLAVFATHWVFGMISLLFVWAYYENMN